MAGKKILVLDDDPVVTLSCKRLLEDEGFETSMTDRGRNALRLMESERFDLLISDIRLPDISGMTVVREARAVHPETDVLIITGYPTLNDAKESIRLGVLEYIEKPFVPDSLVSAVKNAFDKKDWTLKPFMEVLKDHIIPLRDEGVIHYEDGAWARPVEDGMWELGCDVRYLILSGNLVYVDFIRDMKTIRTGEPFARLITSTGRVVELVSPLTGEITGLNTKVNDVLVALTKNHASEGWLLRLAKVLPAPAISQGLAAPGPGKGA